MPLPGYEKSQEPKEDPKVADAAEQERELKEVQEKFMATPLGSPESDAAFDEMWAIITHQKKK